MPELPEQKPKPHLPVTPRPPSPIPYAELHVTSNFSFLRGASHPEELVARAAELGCHAIALTDINTLAGIVRAHVAAKETKIPFLVGCHLQLGENPINCQLPMADSQSAIGNRQLAILLYPTDRPSYGRLCRLLTHGKRRTAKGHCDLALQDLIDHHQGLLAIVLPPPLLDPAFTQTLHHLKDIFTEGAGDRLSLAAACLYNGLDSTRLAELAAVARETGIPLVATNDVHYHIPERQPLQDVLTCIRLGCTIDQAGFALFANAERHLKTPEEMARLFRDHPAAIRRTLDIARRAAAFSLDQLKYEYPHEICPPGKTLMQHLKDRTWAGAHERYASQNKAGDGIAGPPGNQKSKIKNQKSPPGAIPPSIRDRLEHEFQLIEQLNYPAYFLTVDDIVTFARSKGILCQGRGAAANSAVCYCLGITAVDPARIDLLVERFISKERDEPPDIDIDFEHERREEVIQYLYNKYGRDRAALTAEVISYRRRSAVREVGKAMGLSLDCVDRLAKSGDWWEHSVISEPRLRDLGFDPRDPTLRRTITLAQELIGFPRHLSQHVGGFVLSRGPLCESVPIENASMPDRTVIEWDKDDIDALGMLKVDILALGMLTAIRKTIDLVNANRTRSVSEGHEIVPTPSSPAPVKIENRKSKIENPLHFHTIPPEDPAIYDMLCNADSIGVFQVESRPR